VFAIENLRHAHKQAASKYTRLRAAVLDFLERKGMEGEDGYLVRLEREVGRKR
jgi:Fe2+ or Zn2+ uptake regulation protein